VPVEVEEGNVDLDGSEDDYDHCDPGWDSPSS
jgi:hypothetical protein